MMVRGGEGVKVMEGQSGVVEGKEVRGGGRGGGRGRGWHTLRGWNDCDTFHRLIGPV